jgi:hypothetical protein
MAQSPVVSHVPGSSSSGGSVSMGWAFAVNDVSSSSLTSCDLLGELGVGVGVSLFLPN